MSGRSVELAAKVPLGGMAFANGVLVHGPHAWACAVRTSAGEIEVASGRKPSLAGGHRSPLVRGVLRLAEALAVVPLAGQALPDLRTPYRDPRVVTSLLLGVAASGRLRRTALPPLAREAALAVVSLLPALALVRGGAVAGYHGAEHVTIGSWEHGVPRPRAHERCGSHLVAPLILSTVAGNALVERLTSSRQAAATGRAIVGVAALGLSLELFGWASRNRQQAVARALAWPGSVLQERVLTAEPSPEQLAVAHAALEECLRLEAAAT